MININTRNILVFRIGSIGDTLISMPALKLLKKSYPNAKFTVLSNYPLTNGGKECPLKDILDGEGIFDNFIEYKVEKINLSNLINFIKTIKKINPDLFVYLMPIRSLNQLIRDWILFKFCGFKNIIGLRFSAQMQTRIFDAGSGFWEHESHRLLRLISKKNIEDRLTDDMWSLNLSLDEKCVGENILKVFGGSPFIVLSMGTKVDVKDWGEVRWVELVKLLSGLYSSRYRLVLFGSRDEFSRCENVAKLWDSKALNLCGKISPRISAAVLEKATLFIGHDSGPMHLSAAVGTPVIAIFSSRNKPGEWYPLGSQNTVIYHKVNCFGCELSTCIVEKKKCISSISVEEVFNSVELKISNLSESNNKSLNSHIQ